MAQSEETEGIKDHLIRLNEFFARVASGENPREIEIPKLEDHFTPVYVGIQMLLDMLNERIDSADLINRNLSLTIDDTSYALAEAQRIANLGFWEWFSNESDMRWSDQLFVIFGLKPRPFFPFAAFLACIHSADRDQARIIIHNSCRDLSNFEFTVRVFRSDGEVRIFHNKGTARRDEAGRGCKVIGVCRDITEERKAEISLREMNLVLEKKVAERTRELELSNAELESFAYVVSHDLKAPLRAIGSITDWIIQDFTSKIGEEGIAQLKLLKNRVTRMNNLIHGILDYSRVMNATETVYGPVDVQTLVTDIFDTLDYNRTSKLSIPEKLPVIRFNRTLLGQVFENLIGNGLKHNIREEKVIEVSWKPVALGIQFNVSDNGNGIPERYHQKIFQLFQTLTARDEMESTGIGLTIVKKVIDRAGGAIRVFNMEAGGACFSFTIPADLLEPQNNGT